MQLPLIIVVAYNPNKSILQNLNIANSYLVIVVDNSECKPIWLESYCSDKNIKYIFNGGNLGIAVALNIACQFAIDNNYSWVITMDQDSMITCDIIQGMLNFRDKLNYNEIAIISPRHVLQDDIKIKVSNEIDEYSEGISTMTSGNLLNLKIWQTMGGFIADLFIDMVDVDYYCRAVLNRFRVITINHLYMQHQLGDMKKYRVLGKSITVNNHNHIRKYYQIRNGLYVYFKYKNAIPEVKFVRKFLCGLFILLPFEANRLKKLYYMTLGIIDYIRGKYGKK